ncbi:MAG: NAD(P)-dependent alcohol dehydrogenase [Saprospiraceae bacterium]|nr:NAD(P)-dependent alcohol dehydrogenase [Saprospiraceae bacterium]
MKAAVRPRYGPPEALSVREVPMPTPRAREILVKIHAATVNRTDCAMLTGTPFVYRLFIGLWKPKRATTGTDFAGEVVAIGDAVKAYQVGDRVWGFDDIGLSSHAQYAAISERVAMEFIPDKISYEQVVASAEGAHYALNFLKKVKLEAGQKALVNGATGAIGSALLQLLKHRGLFVTAVCGTPHMERVRALGADKIIDYLQSDFTLDDERYHYVFDAVGKSTFGKCKPILARGGIYISSELGPYSQNLFLPLFTRFFSNKKVIFPIPFNIKRSLQTMKKLLEEGRYQPLIDRHYALEDIQEAFRYAASGHKIGNLVVKF